MWQALQEGCFKLHGDEAQSTPSFFSLFDSCERGRKTQPLPLGAPLFPVLPFPNLLVSTTYN